MFFHFCQAIISKIKKVGLKGLYSKNDEFKILIQKIMLLALVHPDHVISEYNLISNDLVESFGERFGSKLDEFLNYFQSTWCSENSRFPIRMWNHFKTLFRTNNFVES